MLVRARTGLAGAGLCVITGRLTAEGAVAPDLFFAAASILLVIGFAQAVNDIVDCELDRVDKAHRPLPSGALSTRAAVRIAAGCAGGALLLAAVVGGTQVAFAAILLLLSWRYSVRWKSTVLWGNFVVAALASCSVSYGVVAVGALDDVTIAVHLLVFIFGFAFEILKDAVDVRGDQVSGVVTLATQRGVRVAAATTAALAVLSVALATAPAFLIHDPIPYLIAVGVGFALPAAVSAVLLAVQVQDESDLKTPYRLMRVAWVGGILSLVWL